MLEKLYTVDGTSLSCRRSRCYLDAFDVIFNQNGNNMDKLKMIRNCIFGVYLFIALTFCIFFLKRSIRLLWKLLYCEFWA